MTIHSIDQAAATNGHRPMSLLLQALKQIESRLPDPAIDGDAQTGEVGGTHAPSDEAPLSSLPQIVGGSLAERPKIAGCESTIQVIRHYRETETASEVAAAQPVELPTLALITSDDERPGYARRSADKQRQLADELLQLLHDDSRAVVAIIAADGSDVSPLLFDVCEGLAARNAGAVLAIAREESDEDFGVARPTLHDVISGRASWHAALPRRPYTGCALLQRGDWEPRGPGFQRRLLRLWEEMASEYAFIAIDATAGDVEEVAPVVATCDAAFLAVRLHETNRHDTERLIARIRSSGCHPCGCLVAG